jgi:hypothetical protein
MPAISPISSGSARGRDNPMRTCPVCGYDQLRRPPADHLIGPSCGTQFEYHDSIRSHEELREQWVAGGMLWHSRARPAPEGWDPHVQLARVATATPE